MSNGTGRYGGFDLRRGDSDTSRVWGGSRRSTSGRHVEQLQRDLHDLGFLIVGGADGGFGRRTEQAVREYQIYAGMVQVARESASSTAARYVDRLSSVTTRDDRYRGPVSGVVNAATRAALDAWVRKRWRCPVVVEAWNMSSGRRRSLRGGNLWLHDDLVSSMPRMYARDFSDYYSMPTGRLDDGLVVLGDFVKFLRWSGPRSVPARHTWPEGELLPEALIGKPLAALSPAELSTYKTVRAVSEVECLGFFDSVNCYDNAFVSQGPCHWTLGIVNPNRSVSDGELCGFLSYLEHAEPTAFAKAFGFFGIRPDTPWVDAAGRPSGRRLFLRDQLKYAGWLAVERDDGSVERLEKSEAAGNALKSWHWFYRFVMAGRTIDGYRRAMWTMARVRLRDLLEAPWGSGVAGVETGTGTRLPRIGDVFTSERAAAILLRWHIRFPADVVAGGRAGARLRAALASARAAGDGLAGDPSRWGAAQERALLDGLRAAVAARGNDNLSQTVSQVDDWPSWARGANPRGYLLSRDIGRLSVRRGSLEFDPSGLPARP